MARLITSISLSLALLGAGSVATAGDRTVTLSVDRMICAVCAANVKRSLEGVPGVAAVRVGLKEKIAVVIYDDSKADLKSLTNATQRAGFPSALRN